MNEKLRTKRASKKLREENESNQRHLMTALDSLGSEGITSASGYEIAKRDAQLRNPDNPIWYFMGEGRIFRALEGLVDSGQLTRIRYEDERRIARYLYSMPEPTETPQE